MAANHQQTAPDNTDALWDERRRKELRVAGLTALVLLAGTLYFGGANAWLLYRSAPRPFQLSLSQPPNAGLTAVYHATVVWDSWPGKTAPTRPVLRIGDQPVPDAAARPSAAAPAIATGRRYELRFEIPGHTSVGAHLGILRLQKVSGSPDAQETLSSPVAIEVVGGLRKSWFLLCYWLVATAAILALLYCFFFLVAHTPSGELSVEYFDGVLRRHGRVTLRPAPGAWLTPWRRSALPLRRVCRKACIPEHGIRSEIVFRAKGVPALVVPSGETARIFHGRPAAAYRPGPQLRPCGRVQTMYDSSFVMFPDLPHPAPYIVFRYVS